MLNEELGLLPFVIKFCNENTGPAESKLCLCDFCGFYVENAHRIPLPPAHTVVDILLSWNPDMPCSGKEKLSSQANLTKFLSQDTKQILDCLHPKCTCIFFSRVYVHAVYMSFPSICTIGANILVWVPYVLIDLSFYENTLTQASVFYYSSRVETRTLKILIH